LFVDSRCSSHLLPSLNRHCILSFCEPNRLQPLDNSFRSSIKSKILCRSSSCGSSMSCQTKNKTRSDKTRQDKTRQDQTRQDQTRQDKIRQDKTRQDQTRQDKTRQDKTRSDKTRQDKTRSDKTRHRQNTLEQIWISSDGKSARSACACEIKLGSATENHSPPLKRKSVMPARTGGAGQTNLGTTHRREALPVEWVGLIAQEMPSNRRTVANVPRSWEQHGVPHNVGSDWVLEFVWDLPQLLFQLHHLSLVPLNLLAECVESVDEVHVPESVGAQDADHPLEGLVVVGALVSHNGLQVEKREEIDG
jgi:hypothetical protein